MRNIRCKPLRFTRGSKPTGLFKFVLNLGNTHTAQIKVKYHSDCFGLFRVDYQFFTYPIIPKYIAVSVENTVLHRRCQTVRMRYFRSCRLWFSTP